MTNQSPNSEDKKFDLLERSQEFSISIVRFLKPLRETTVSRPLISQLIRSATSIGANYMEADVAESKRDFYHKISICRKEAKETLHWLILLQEYYPQLKDEIRKLYKEAHEFVLIFGSIVSRKKKD